MPPCQGRHMTPRMLGCIVGVVLAVGSSQVAAQPLATVARQEQARRAALAAQAQTDEDKPKVYTIADLRGAGRLTTGGAVPAPASEPPDEAAEEETADTTAPPGEEAWRSRINAVREAQQRAELLAEALQNRVDTLWADFTSRDDPAQRTVLEQSRQAALEELVDTREQIDALSQEMADIRTEARRASVPAGWLR